VVIGGDTVTTAGEIASVNPSHPSEVVGLAGRAGIAEADQAVAAARAAWPSWGATPPADRAGVLFRAAEILRERRAELAAWEVLEAGKPWREAEADVAEAIDYCEYYAREMLRLAPFRRLADLPGEVNEYGYRPRGVAAVIAPWNFPLAILAGMTTAALVAGNAVIMKPAEQTPVVAALFHRGPCTTFRESARRRARAWWHTRTWTSSPSRDREPWGCASRRWRARRGRASVA
jgi:acyl-CoA reductase-like NAD-dependent aldehyde dehydrogenase